MIALAALLFSVVPLATGIPAGGPRIAAAQAPYADGDVVRVPGNTTIFALAGGAKFAFTSPEAFEQAGYTEADVKTISGSELGQFGSVPENGTLLRGHNRPTRYVVAGGARFDFTSDPAFAEAGYDDADVVTVQTERIDGLPTVPRNRTLLSGHDRDTVNVIAGGARFLFTSTAALTEAGYDPGDVVKVQSARIDSIPTIPADGTLLGPHDRDTIHVIAGGARFLFTSIPALTEAGYSLNNVIKVQSERIDAITTVPADGTLLKGHGRETLYVIAGGARFAFSTPAIVELAGHDPADVVTIQSERIDAITTVPADGTLLKGHGRETLYVIAGGARFAFSTPAIAELAGHDPAEVVTIQSERIDAMTSVPVNGTLLGPHDRDTIHVIAGGARFLFTSIPALVQAGYQEADVVKVQSERIDALPTTPSNRTLLRGHNRDTIHVIAGGARFLFTSIPALVQAGYREADVVNVQSQRIDPIPTIPANGTLLGPHDRDTVYAIAGGAKFLFTFPQALLQGGYQPEDVVKVQSTRIDPIGTIPIDGTVLRGHDDERFWRIVEGRRLRTSPTPEAVVVQTNRILSFPRLAGVTSVDPARLLDTRAGESTVDDRFAGGGRVAARSVTRVRVEGRGGVPIGAEAVILNVTAVGPLGVGFLTVYECTPKVPTASNVNYGPGDIAPNAVLAKLSTEGEICVYSEAATDLIVDVNGYVPVSSSPTPLSPARLLDTRRGKTTVDGAFAGGGRVGAGKIVKVQMTGRGGVPEGADAVMLNVTAVHPLGVGFLTVYECTAKVPKASNVNYGPGDIAPNAVFAKLSPNGSICIYTEAATDLVVDVNGFVSDGRSPTPVSPARLMDTRPGETTIDGGYQGSGRAKNQGVTTLKIAGRGGVPADANAAVINVTAVKPRGAGFLTVYGCTRKVPNASNVNYERGDIAPNAVLAKLSPNGSICIYTEAATNLVVDVSAYMD